MERKNTFHAQEIKDILHSLGTYEHGLTSEEARRRIVKNGYNELSEARRDSYVQIFFRQFKNPLIYVLLISGGIVFLMKEMTDALVIFFVLVFNAIIGAFQEGKAQNTFLALKRFIKTSAVVLRDGEEVVISDKEVAVGDIIILREGEKTPADARIISANSLMMNESALTGESMPKYKNNLIIKDKSIPIYSQDNIVFKGTTVVSGTGKAVVVAIGADTFLGEIAKETLDIDHDFPLKNEIKKLSNWIMGLVFLASMILFVLGLINGYSLREIFKTIVAVAVSVIPEGLPIVMTLVLVGGVWRMGKKNVLIKKLQAVEVLGETNILAVDKTGTVTKNELVIQEVFAGRKNFKIEGIGYEQNGEVRLEGDIIDPLIHPEIFLAGRLAALNSRANLIFEKRKKKWRVIGDPTEAAMSVLAKKIGFHQDSLLVENKMIAEIPFDYELKFHATLHQQERNKLLIISGSPEKILELSRFEIFSDEKIELKETEIKNIQAEINQMSENGLRVIGFCYCSTDMNSIDLNNMPKMIFGGLFGIKDALREEVVKAVMQVRNCGIKVVMITGDHENTARAIAQEAGIYTQGDTMLSGKEIANMSKQELAVKISSVSVFSRITPGQKLEIIKAYQSNGTVIAMTGDGVNDALSLTAADIGISMGKIGTEVAKEASDVVLLDDNFGSIVHGVEEGRNIFANMRKVILYLLSTSIGEFLTIAGALLLGWPLPILAAQILWLNLVTDGFLDIALSAEPKEEGRIIEEQKDGFIVNGDMIKRMFFMALPMALGTLYLFSQNYANDLGKAWTMSLTSLAIFQWFNAWNCRSEEKSIFTSNPFSNKFLFGATLLVIGLQLLAIYNQFFQKILHTVPLGLGEWKQIIAVAFSIVIVEETRKLFVRMRRRKKISQALDRSSR